MRKDILTIACLCVLCIAGCKKETLGESAGRRQMEVDVTGRNYSTKAGETDQSDGELLCTKHFVTQGGDTLFISAYLSDLEDYFPVQEESSDESTKGVPIYFNEDNKNLGSEYGIINTTVYDASRIYVSKDKDQVESEMKNVSILWGDEKWSFDKQYYWPNEGGDLYFCSLAPVELLSGDSPLITDVEWNKSDSRKMTFKYSMPEPAVSEPYCDAEHQMDILVGVDKNNKDESSQAHISLYHALTGVRFVMGETLDDMPSKLTSVSLNNFYSKGTATFDPASTHPKVTWSELSELKNFTQGFPDYDGWVEDNSFDTSSDKSKTFMVIPQELDENAELAIYLASGLHPEVLKLSVIASEETSLKDWSNYAGKMITFRINSYVGLVSVKVTDDCDTANGVKSNIEIENDGNADIFIRAELVGNWINEDGEVLASWKEDNSYGEFESAAGTKNANLASVLDENWEKAADGFYYYKYYVKPGNVLKHNMFKTFTLKSKPVDADGQWEGEVKMQIDALELSILVQAVRAESDKKSAIDAWGSANVGFLTNTADN